MEVLQREELPMATLPTGRPATPLRQRMLIAAVLHIWGSAMTYHPHIHLIATSGLPRFDLRSRRTTAGRWHMLLYPEKYGSA